MLALASDANGRPGRQRGMPVLARDARDSPSAGTSAPRVGVRGGSS